MTAPGASSRAKPFFQRALEVMHTRLRDGDALGGEWRQVLEADACIGHEVDAAIDLQNGACNRYVNVLPYDYNRVKLHSPPDYINASHVAAELPGGGYIASQGPLPATIGDFWRMVLEQQSTAVVMLTNVNEKGVVKCAQYFPTGEGETMQAQGGVQVQLLATCSPLPGATRRSLRVSRPGQGVAHTLEHWHYHAWPDHGTPRETEGIRALCHALDACRQRPIVVHCSAGIGRTGTFCAIDVTLQRLKRWAAAPPAEPPEALLDLPTLVHGFRQQRMGMVQVFEQYVYCYRAIVDELRLMAA